MVSHKRLKTLLFGFSQRFFYTTFGVESVQKYKFFLKLTHIPQLFHLQMPKNVSGGTEYPCRICRECRKDLTFSRR